MPRKIRRTLPNKQKGTRGDTYVNNHETIIENLKLVNKLTQKLVDSNTLLGQHILSYQSQLRTPALKNNPLADLISPILESLRLQVSVTNQNLAMIATSALTVQQAADDNYQIVQDHIELPSGLENMMVREIKNLIDQQQELIELLQDYLD